MNSIVLELQNDALNSNTSITELVRKAYFVSKKLNLKDLSEWLECEMNGYDPSKTDIPDYRIVTGRVEAFNPYRGWIHAQFGSDELEKYCNSIKCQQSISEIEAIKNSGTAEIMVDRTSDMRNFTSNIPGAQIRLRASAANLYKIIESVRKIVLDWSIKLEGDGILGENMSFSSKEKETAKEKNYTINITGNGNNIGIQENVTNSSQSIGVSIVTTEETEKVKEALIMLSENIGLLKLSNNQKKLIDREVKVIEKELIKSEPVKHVIKEAFSTVRNILEGVSGSIIASGLIHHFGLFL